MAPKKGKQKVDEATEASSAPFLDVLPDPIVTFDIGDIDNLAENYESCVKRIISVMKDETEHQYTFVVNGQEIVVPVTPGKSNTKDGTYVIHLKHGDTSLYLVAKKYQNWFIGIVTQGGQRFEIDQKPKVLLRSHSLGTDGSYTDLLPGDDIARVKLGYQQLLWAFYMLAKLGEGAKRDFKKEKLAITIIILMFFEGPRFLEVYELIIKALIERVEVELGEHNQTQISNWCDYCRDLYHEKGYERRFVISDDTSDNVKRVAAKIRIMCRSQWDSWVNDRIEGNTSRSKS